MIKPIFRKLSTHTSYGLAIAVFSVFGGQVLAAAGFVFILLIANSSPDRQRFHSISFITVVIVVTLVHYALFGLLRPWSRRWELASIRQLNDWVQGDSLSSEIPTAELSQITRMLELLPMLNLRLSALLGGLAVLCESGVELVI